MFTAARALVALALSAAVCAGAPAAAEPIAAERAAKCTVVGTPGDDVLRGTRGRDVLCGRGGDDRLIGAGGADVLLGGAGHDVLVGGAGRDELSGGAGDDELRAGRGADLLDGGAGDDDAQGQSGKDRVSFAGEDGIEVDLTLGTSVGSTAGTDVLSAVENVRGTPGADRIAGADGANHLDGGAGDDDLEGLGGNDTLLGGAGEDTLQGGAADDKLSGGPDADEVDGGDGINICSPGSGDVEVLACSITVVFALDQVALVKGTVSTADGLAVPGLRLRSEAEEGVSEVRSADDGTFAMAVVKGLNEFSLNDAYDDDPWYPAYLEVGLPGEFRLSTTLDVSGDMELPIAMPRAHPVTVTVTNGDGEPLGGARITSERAAGFPADSLWPGGPAVEDGYQNPTGCCYDIVTDEQGVGTFYAFETRRMRARVRYQYGDGLTLQKWTPYFSVRSAREVDAVL